MSVAPPQAIWLEVIQGIVALSSYHADSSNTLSKITQIARQALGSHACTLTRLDLTAGHLTTVACAGPDEAFVEAMRGRKVNLGAGRALDPEVINQGVAFARYDLPRDGQGVAAEEIARRHGLQSVLSHPLVKRNGDFIGYLNHFSHTNEPFLDPTRQLLEIFAGQAVTAIERLEWQKTFERSVDALNALSENVLADRENFLEEVARTACTLLSVPVCIVWQRARQEEKLTIVAATDNVDAEFRRTELDLDSPGIRQAVGTRDVKWMLDVTKPNPVYSHRAEAKKRGWVSLLCAPMWADRLIGMLDVYTTSPRRFEPWEREFFGLFANYAALSISTFGLHTRLEALNELTRKMTEADTIEQVLELFLDGGLSLVGASRGWISRVDLRTGELGIQLAKGEPPHKRTLKWGEGITGRAVELGQVLNVPDVTAPEWKDIYVDFWTDTRSELAVPIMLHNVEVRKGTEVRRGSKPIGVLNVESPKVNGFTQTSENLLRSLAQHAATVIEKLEFDERLSKLRTVERAMGQLATYEETALKVLETVKTTLDYDFVNMSFVNHETGCIKSEFVLGFSSEEEQEAFMRMADHPLDGEDIQAYIVRQNVAEVPAPFDPRFDPAIHSRFRHKDLLRVFVPMRLPQGNRVIGTIEAGYNRTDRRFIYERDVNMLQGFADYAALALEHKKLMSFNLYLAAVLREGLAAVGATQGSVVMLNNSTNRLDVIERQGRPYAPGYVRLEPGRGIAGIAVRERHPLRIADILDNEHFVHAAKGEPNFRSMLVAPLVTGDRCIGAICAHGETVNKFSQEDEDRLVALANTVAATINQLGVDAFMGHTKRLNQLERFRSVPEELTRVVRERPKLREQIAKAALSLFDADSVVLYEYHADKGSFDTPPTLGGDIRVPAAMNGQVHTDRAPYAIVRKSASHFAERAREDELMHSRVDPASAEPAMTSFVEREGILSSAGIPLKAGNEMTGVLFLNYRESHAFSVLDKHLIGGFASDAAIALLEARVVLAAVLKNREFALQQTRSVAAHRFKGPLISMRRRLIDILAQAEGPEVKHLALDASELNRHLQNLIADFNSTAKHPTFARLEHTSREQLESLLNRALRSNRTRVDTDASVNIAPDVPPIRIDREAYEDDFIGLLHDSERHAAAATKVTVDVTAASLEDLRRWKLPETQAFVKFAYRDNGTGVPPHLKERIFDENFSTAVDGTGLGLAIARDNAVRHGGAIHECGEYTKGVLFELYLPVDTNPPQHDGHTI